jgi:hypothetical protein
MQHLHEGSCVVPLCGGPVMVIFAILGSTAYCRWLDGRALGGATFPLSALTEAPSGFLLQPHATIQ